MNQERLKQLLSFLREDPEDPFTLFAIALEYRHVEDAKSRKYFEKLLDEHPDYLGTYYHAAALYIDVGENGLAERVYKNGLTLAKNLGDLKTYKELKSAYDEFLSDDSM